MGIAVFSIIIYVNSSLIFKNKHDILINYQLLKIKDLKHQCIKTTRKFKIEKLKFVILGDLRFKNINSDFLKKEFYESEKLRLFYIFNAIKYLRSKFEPFVLKNLYKNYRSEQWDKNLPVMSWDDFEEKFKNENVEKYVKRIKNYIKDDLFQKMSDCKHIPKEKI